MYIVYGRCSVFDVTVDISVERWSPRNLGGSQSKVCFPGINALTVFVLQMNQLLRENLQLWQNKVMELETKYTEDSKKKQGVSVTRLCSLSESCFSNC